MASEIIKTNLFDNVCALDLLVRPGQIVKVLHPGKEAELYRLISSSVWTGVARLEKPGGESVETIAVPASWVFAGS